MRCTIHEFLGDCYDFAIEEIVILGFALLALLVIGLEELYYAFACRD